MIELLSVQGNDNTIANTARVSMGAAGEWEELPKDYTVPQRDRLIGYLAKHQHTSPFRHTSIILRCKIPIFLARQLGKHQVGMSWNEVSRRYVKTEPEFFYPDAWRAVPEGSIKQGSAGKHKNHDTIQDSYDAFVHSTLDYYNSLLAEGVAPEMARMVLPQSMMTEYIWTGSLMAFAHVYNLRSKEGAQVEAREFADELTKIIEPLFPVAWKALTGG